MQELFDAHSKAVRKKLRKLGVSGPDLQEMVQSVFAVAYRRRKEVPHHPGGTRRWLLDTARKHAANWHRLYRHYYEVHDPEAIETALAPPEDPEAEYEQRELVREATLRLSPQDREVLIRHDIDGESLREIGISLNLTKSGAHVRLTLARQRFIAALERVQRQNRFYLPLVAALAALLRGLLGAPSNPESMPGETEPHARRLRLPAVLGSTFGFVASLVARVAALLVGPLLVLTLYAVWPASTDTGPAKPERNGHALPVSTDPGAPQHIPPEMAPHATEQTETPPPRRTQSELVQENDDLRQVPALSAPASTWAAPGARTDISEPLAANPLFLDEQVSARISKIREMLLKGDFQEAIKEFTTLITQYPDAPNYPELAKLHRSIVSVNAASFDAATAEMYVEALAELDPMRPRRDAGPSAAP